jgi:hypothetical protein
VNDRFRPFIFVALCGIGTALGSPARAHPEVVARLMEHGDLSAVEAKVLVKAVSKRMQRAASPHARKDKMRVTVARALHEPHAKSRRGRERVAIRLRAGLDLWALNHLFAPDTYSRASCERQFKLSDNLCESLAAAAGSSSRAQQARAAAAASNMDEDEETDRAKVASGPRATGAAPVASRPLTARERAKQRKADAAAKRRLAKEMKREAALAKREAAREKRLQAKQHKRELASFRAQAKQQRIDAERERRAAIVAAREQREQEKRDAIVRKREAVAAAKAERERERLAAIQRKRDEAERVERERLAAIQAERDRVEVARRKAEYQKQREAYLERQREQLAARKARTVANAEGEKVKRGPASELEAQLIGLSPADAATAEQSGKDGKGSKGGKAKPGSNKGNSMASKASADAPNGLDMVDALVAEPSSAKSVARR